MESPIKENKFKDYFLLNYCAIHGPKSDLRMFRISKPNFKHPKHHIFGQKLKFEHVEHWKKYIYQTSNLLNDNGLNIIFAPNYDFPYEPHFVIPIIINKKITKFLFNRKIKKSEMSDTGNESGLWEGLNFIGKRKVEKFLKKNSYPYFFDFSIKNRMLNRIINDNELKRRQGIGGRIAIFAKNFYIDKLIFDLLKVPFPYMKFIINKKK